jgi:hypothetical protein
VSHAEQSQGFANTVRKNLNPKVLLKSQSFAPIHAPTVGGGTTSTARRKATANPVPTTITGKAASVGTTTVELHLTNMVGIVNGAVQKVI